VQRFISTFVSSMLRPPSKTQRLDNNGIEYTTAPMGPTTSVWGELADE
jgi:hypothetical protein